LIDIECDMASNSTPEGMSIYLEQVKVTVTENIIFLSGL